MHVLAKHQFTNKLKMALSPRIILCLPQSAQEQPVGNRPFFLMSSIRYSVALS